MKHAALAARLLRGPLAIGSLTCKYAVLNSSNSKRLASPAALAIRTSVLWQGNENSLLQHNVQLQMLSFSSCKQAQAARAAHHGEATVHEEHLHNDQILLAICVT